MEYKIPDVSTLKRIRSLSELNVDQLIALANQLQIFTAKKGDLLLERGSIDESSIYLLRGSISLIAADGQIKQLTVSEKEELNPVAKLRPCIYDIEAQETIEYLKINKQALVEFSQMSVTISGDISVYSLYSNESDHTKFLIQDLYRNIGNEEVKMIVGLVRAAGRSFEAAEEILRSYGKRAHGLYRHPVCPGRAPDRSSGGARPGGRDPARESRQEMR